MSPLQPSSLPYLQIARLKRHASSSPLNWSMETSHSTGQAANHMLAAFVPHCERNSTWPCYSFHTHTSQGRSASFLRQRLLFLLENLATFKLSRLQKSCLSHHRQGSARLQVNSTKHVRSHDRSDRTSQCMWTSIHPTETDRRSTEINRRPRISFRVV